MHSWVRVLAGALVLSGCGREAGPSVAEEAEPRPKVERTTIAPAESIDPTIPPAIAGEQGWNYHQSTSLDLTGDGMPERVVLTARVELYRGRPAWDDGQPWQVYVEGRDDRRVYLYSQRLQLGTLAMRVSREASGHPPTIILIEHLPDRLRVLEASYTGSTPAFSLALRFERDLDPRGDPASPVLP
jgi:hypothetical protein